MADISMRHPGFEPGSSPWEGDILTTILMTLRYIQKPKFKYSFFISFLWQRKNFTLQLQ
jgi:hypothetical protein